MFIGLKPGSLKEIRNTETHSVSSIRMGREKRGDLSLLVLMALSLNGILQITLLKQNTRILWPSGRAWSTKKPSFVHVMMDQ
jgi:hypothetical protein